MGGQKMYYGNIKKSDIANGIGVRVSLLSVDVLTIAKVVLMKKPGILNTDRFLRRRRRSRSFSGWSHPM